MARTETQTKLVGHLEIDVSLTVGAPVMIAALCVSAVVATTSNSASSSAQLQGATASNRALPLVVASVRAARRGAPIPKRLVPRLRDLRGLPRKYAPANDCIGHDRSAVSTTRICRMGDRSSGRLLVLVGDSHAAMWLPAVLEMAQRFHWQVIPLLRLGCTPGKWTTGYGSAACHAWYRWALREAGRLRPRATLLGGSIDQRPTPATRRAIEGIVTAAQTLASGGSTVVVGDPEGLNFNPVECLRSRAASMATCTTTWPAQALAPYDEIARRVARGGAGFLGTRGFVCFERSCPAVIGHTIAWVDGNHMSAAYAAELGVPFNAAFTSAVRMRRR